MRIIKSKKISEFLSKYDFNNPKFCELFLTSLTTKQLEIFFLAFNTDSSIFLSESQIARIIGVSRQNINIIISNILKTLDYVEDKYYQEQSFTSISLDQQLIEIINKINYLKYKVVKIILNNNYKDKFSCEEEKIINDYNLLKDELSKLLIRIKIIRIHSLKLSSKAQELIKTINTIHRLPFIKNNNGESEFTFDDGTDQRRYYVYLRSCVKNIQNKIDNNEKLSRSECQNLYDYKEITKALEKYAPSYNTPYCYHEINIALRKNASSYKTQQLVETINSIYRLPLLKSQNSGESEFTFDDGTDQRRYYVYLRSCVKNIQDRMRNNEKLSISDYKNLNDYTVVNNVLSFYKIKPDNKKMLIISLLKELGIDSYKNKDLLSKSFYEIYIKIRYMIDNNMRLVDDNGLINKIMYMSDLEMQLTYNISFSQLIKKYINGDINSLEAKKRLIKL